ncbi:hypothetical protein DL770_008201 [Monosporascus sp. CRB-9-2]|nr:hypothetical protein DL770_008201 [Monosporascus sp. CRB-9-2]
MQLLVTCCQRQLDTVRTTAPNIVILERTHDQKFDARAPTRSRRPGEKTQLAYTQFWVVILGLNSGMLPTALDFNIVAAAVPIISSESQEYSNSQWPGTAFLIIFALIQPICVKLGDMWGRKNLFLFCTIVFTLGSALCGWSSSMDMLIWSRAIQGIGAGGIYGQTNVIITDLVDLRDAGKYLSVTAAVWGIADVAGLLRAAYPPSDRYVTWRWCFWINFTIAPISFLIVLDVLRLPMPEDTVKDKILLFDYHGTVLVAGGTASLVLDGVMLVLFIAAERLAKFPLVDLSMFKGRTLIAIFGAEFSMAWSYVLPPAILPASLRRYRHTVWCRLLPMMLGLLVGTGQGAIMSGLLLSAQVAVKPAEIGVLTGFCIFVQCVGNIFGIALFAAVYVNRLSESLAQLGLEAQEVAHVLADVQGICSLFSLDVVEVIVDVYANSMQNG